MREMNRQINRNQCLSFVRVQHQGQYRPSGEPYYNHLVRVAELAFVHSNEESVYIVGLLHDYLEDVQGASLDQVPFLLTQEEQSAIHRLTKIPNERFENYIARVSGSRIASIVKISDRIDNTTAPNPIWTSERNTEYLAQSGFLYESLEGPEEIRKILLTNINKRQ